MFKDVDMKHECILRVYKHAGFSLSFLPIFPANGLSSPEFIYCLALGKGYLILTAPG